MKNLDGANRVSGTSRFFKLFTRPARSSSSPAPPGAHDLGAVGTFDALSLHGAGPAVNRPEVPRTKIVPGARATDTVTDFPWGQELRVRRSEQGVHSGVYFVTAGPRMVVVKGSRTIGEELLAARLAALVGLAGPALHAIGKIPESLRIKIGARGPEHRKILAMPRIAGVSFRELTEEHREVVLGGGPGRPAGLLSEMGRVLAFDYFIRNPDRFPCRGLDACNTGNLMLDGAGLQVIDSTLPHLAADQEMRRYHRQLGDILTLVKDPHHTGADALLSPITQFFPSQWQVGWTDIRPHIVAGFSAQARVIAQIDRKHIKACVKEARRHGPVASPQEAALIAQLDLFKMAVR